jgi:hypothetical protein
MAWNTTTSTVVRVRQLFHERFLAALPYAARLKTVTSFPRAALPFAAGLLPTSRCNGLGGEVLMLALLHKRIYEKKRRHHYWVLQLLCTGLETG